jgi:hypothetical protein
LASCGAAQPGAATDQLRSGCWAQLTTGWFCDKTGLRLQQCTYTPRGALWQTDAVDKKLQALCTPPHVLTLLGKVHDESYAS